MDGRLSWDADTTTRMGFKSAHPQPAGTAMLLEWFWWVFYWGAWAWH